MDKKQHTRLKYNLIFGDSSSKSVDTQWGDKGSFKCYVTLEGVGGYMSKRYEGVGGIYVSIT